MEVFPTLPRSHKPSVGRTVCHQTVTTTGGGLIDSLPIEIMGEIFIYCLPENNGLIGSPHIAPLLLCRVSSRWKRIAMAMPALWKAFTLISRRGINEVYYMSMIALYINLSRPHPLELNIGLEDLDNEELLVKAFPLLLCEIDRWKRASIVLTGDLCEQLVAAPVGPNPLLETLTLDMISCHGELEDLFELPDTLAKFPRLRILYLSPDFEAPITGIPWSQLTEINLHCHVPVNDLLDILSEFQHVVRCTLLSIVEPVEDIKPRDIILPFLVDLWIIPECDAGDIFSCLTCPALVHLNIEYELFGTQSPNTLLEFLSRSPCKLETFSLTKGGIQESELINCMKTPALQRVKVLKIYGLGLGTRTLELLKHKRTKATVMFMPYLEEVRLSMDGVPDGSFAAMVASRFQVPGGGTTSAQKPVSLKFVEVTFRRRGHEMSQEDKDSIQIDHFSDVSRLEGFRVHGLRVVIYFIVYEPLEIIFH